MSILDLNWLIISYLIGFVGFNDETIVSASDGTIVMAAFQHEDPSNSSLDQQDIMIQSVDLFEQQISIAASQGAEIVVFPEYGVTGVGITSSRQLIKPYLQVLPSVIPDADRPWNPCLDNAISGFNTTILRRLSCAALNSSLIVVANMGTIVNCNSTDASCPSDGVYQFNSNIAFDKNGTIVSTYHKVHLYLEPQFDVPPYPANYVSTFTYNSTTFGLITCFDILWFYPLVQMVQQNGVNHILMPSAWVDGLPFLTSIQSQQAWTIGLNINLVAANLQKTEDGYRGSGIYSGSAGYINYTYDASSTSRLILSPISLTPGQTVAKISPPAIDYVNYAGIIYDDLSEYSFLALNTTDNTQGNATIVIANITCSVSYALEQSISQGDYMLAGYQGHITLGYGSYDLAIEVCSLLYCSNASDPVNTCSKMTNQPINVKFTQLNLTAKLKSNYVYPNILRSDLQLIDPADWTFSKQVDAEESTNRIQSNSNFSHNLLVASLYGRRYDLDIPNYY